MVDQPGRPKGYELDINQLNWQRYCHYDDNQHSRYIDCEHLLRGREEYFKFAMVRNPWDLAFSWYSSSIKGRTGRMFDAQNYHPKDFYRFLVKYLPSSPSKKLRSKFSKNGYFYILMPRQQLDYVTDNQGVLIVDFLAKYENYEEDISFLAKKFRVNLPTDTRINSSKKKEMNYRDFYDQKSYEFVLNYYRRDIEFLKYSF